MTASYLFAYYTLDRQVSLSFSMNIKTGGVFSNFLLYHYSNFWYYKLLLLWKIGKKKSGENNKLQKMYPNNHEKF